MHKLFTVGIYRFSLYTHPDSHQRSALACGIFRRHLAQRPRRVPYGGGGTGERRAAVSVAAVAMARTATGGGGGGDVYDGGGGGANINDE